MIGINKEDFYKIDWGEVINENDSNMNDAFNIFYETLNEILDRQAPSTKVI